MSSVPLTTQASKLILYRRSTQCSSFSASRTHLNFSASKLQRVHSLRMQRANRQIKGAPYGPIFAERSNRQGEPQRNSEPPTPLRDLVQTFYSCINQKDLGRLEKLISQDCIFEDSTYSRPLHGKMIQNFFKKLTGSMGRHVKFVTDDISEDKDLMTTVIWHMEWKNYRIPLTKGCSFFKCSREGNLLLIKEARVFVESPIKPGELSLDFLKNVVWLPDKFPRLTEWFLKKQDALLQPILKFYKWLLAAVILPVTFYYYSFLIRYAKEIRSFVLRIIRRIATRIIELIVKRFCN